MGDIRNIRIVLEEYFNAINDVNFVVHWKKLAYNILEGLKKSYKQYEPAVVKTIKDIINSVSDFETNLSNFKISTNSVFIHGNKSYVEFEYYGRKKRRELGDIIFILSVKYNNKKYFEKVTINQVKKSKTTSWSFRQDSSKEQLYLLSRFPEFEIFKRKYNLPNYSGCLGTHGLLYAPGDFAIISSKFLDVIVTNKKTCRLEDLLVKNDILCSRISCIPLIHDYEFGEELCHEICYFLHYYPHHFGLGWMCSEFPLFGNNCFAYNVYDFCDKYLRGLIGELIFVDPPQFVYKHPAYDFIQDLFNLIKSKKSIKNNEQILKFISNYQSGGNDGGSSGLGNETDEGPGGFGIIHTTIDLGEGGYNE